MPKKKDNVTELSENPKKVDNEENQTEDGTKGSNKKGKRAKTEDEK